MSPDFSYEEVKKWWKDNKQNFQSNELERMRKVYNTLALSENLPPEDISLMEWIDSIVV